MRHTRLHIRARISVTSTSLLDFQLSHTFYRLVNDANMHVSSLEGLSYEVSYRAIASSCVPVDIIDPPAFNPHVYPFQASALLLNSPSVKHAEWGRSLTSCSWFISQDVIRFQSLTLLKYPQHTRVQEEDYGFLPVTHLSLKGCHSADLDILPRWCVSRHKRKKSGRREEVLWVNSCSF